MKLIHKAYWPDSGGIALEESSSSHQLLVGHIGKIIITHYYQQDGLRSVCLGWPFNSLRHFNKKLL